jgi:two-component system sensor histidine kinase QseC
MLVACTTYGIVIAAITVRDSIIDVHELFDAHLAQTALALLHLTDPDEPDLAFLPGNDNPSEMSNALGRLPNLADRLLQTVDNLGDLANPDSNEVPVIDLASHRSIHNLRRQYELQLRYQIWDRAGKLLLQSANASSLAMTAKDGYSESVSDDGRAWRHYGIWDQHHQFRVLVTEANDLRNRLVLRIALRMTTPLVLGLPILILLLWFSIRKGLHPLALLAREVEARTPDNLSPLDTETALLETLPMVLSLNALLQRIGQTLDSERRFTANAAHELRTPLAAIQAHLHVVRNAAGEAERARAMDKLQLSIERSMRIVTQLLTLARVDPEQALPDSQSVNLGEVAETVCVELAPLALQRDQTMELEVEPGLPPVRGNSDLLVMLLTNLVDNAIRYTPPASHIHISVRRDADGCLLEVNDNGPGIPVTQRERAFERFYRIASQDQPGTGLGLAICRRIAELHGAHIVLADGPDGTGLTVSVVLPSDSVPPQVVMLRPKGESS